VNFLILAVCGAMPAEPPWTAISLICTIYYFAYFLVVLPVLGVIEKPNAPPASIADSIFKSSASHGKASGVSPVAVPAE
jgi:ubiquinol-cytochrome c reductase cytochrome b subunit